MKTVGKRCSRLSYTALAHRPACTRGIVAFAVVFLFVAVLSGCASHTASTPLTLRLYPEGLSGERKVLITGFQSPGGDCVRDEVAAYLSESKIFVPILPPDGFNERQLEKFVEERNVTLVLSGDVDKHLNRPIPGFWTVSLVVATSAKMTVTDTYTDEIIWSLKDSIAINENTGQFVSNNDVKKGTEIACKNLVTKMLNNFARQYIAYERKR